MINKLLLGAGVTVIAVGVSVPAIVSTLTSDTEGSARQEPVSATASRPDEGVRSAEATASAGFLGVVVALQSVDLSAKFDGTLDRLDVHVGDRVKGGTPIARLDPRSASRDLAMAESALRGAEAEHDQSVIELDDATDRRERLHRIPDLVPREQITAADVQEKVAAAHLRSAVADLAGKRTRIEQLKETLRDTQIVAPFDGTIAARYVESGATVSRSAPIVRLISPASLVIRFAVPEEQAAAIKVGRDVTVRVDSEDFMADGVIESIAPEIDAALRMVVVEARLTGGGSRAQTIPSGATARVQFSDHPNPLKHGMALANPPISTGEGSAGHERSID
jgi:RND family efflux transporter MFP subunit